MKKTIPQIVSNLTSSQVDKLMEIMDKNNWNVATALTEKLTEIMAA